MQTPPRAASPSSGTSRVPITARCDELSRSGWTGPVGASSPAEATRRTARACQPCAPDAVPAAAAAARVDQGAPLLSPTLVGTCGAGWRSRSWAQRFPRPSLLLTEPCSRGPPRAPLSLVCMCLTHVTPFSLAPRPARCLGARGTRLSPAPRPPWGPCAQTPPAAGVPTALRLVTS